MLQGNNPIKSYMHDLGKAKLLTREEEAELAIKIAQGCDDSRHKLITSNLRLVVKIAHDFRSYGLPLVDLIGEGNIGLMRAADKFDPTKGSKFSSYAAWWVKQSMRRAIINQSRTIRVPMQSITKLVQIQNAQTRLTKILGRPPTTQEIAEELDCKFKTVNMLQHIAINILSLQEILNEGEQGNYEDVLLQSRDQEPDQFISDHDNLDRIWKLIYKLNDREQTVIIHRYGLDGEKPWTLDRLSKAVGRTRERVRQIQYTAIDKLKNMLEEDMPTGHNGDGDGTS